jgi:glycerate 2-kinase
VPESPDVSNWPKGLEQENEERFIHSMQESMTRSKASAALRVLVAPDKFKGTLSSDQAARAIVRGLRRAWPKAQFARRTIADGGEGFAENLVKATHGKLHRCRSEDALGNACSAQWGMLGDGHTAVIDLASASGLAQLSGPSRDAMRASTFGSGLVMRRAIARGAKTLIIGLGGSATTDGGVGLAQAFGYRFLDAHGDEIPRGGGALRRLANIIAPADLPRVRIIVATDVDNPLHGKNGAAWQFAGQKSADAAAIDELDRGLRQLASFASRSLGKELARAPGAGAAGGCGFGLMTFFNAAQRSGFDVLRDYIDLDGLVRDSDLVITGEGSFDRTSLAGKAPYRLAQLARALGVPTWGIFGRINLATHKLPFERSAALVGKIDQFDPAADHARLLAQTAFALASR